MSVESTVLYIRSIAENYAFYSGVFNTVTGLIGNIILILIFNKMKNFRRNQCSFYLTAESCSNIALIIIIYPNYFIRHSIGYDLTEVSLVWCRIRSMFIQVFGVCSWYIICCATFDQFLSTNHVYSIRRLSTIQLAYGLVTFTFVFWTLHSIIFLIFSEIDKSLFGCAVYNPQFREYLTYFYYPLACNSVPLLVTVFFGIFAYRNAHRIIRRQIPIVRRRLDQQLTSMILTRVCCGTVLGVPYICAQIYLLNTSTHEDNEIKSAILRLVRFVISSLIYANYSIMFYIFIIVSPRFRRQVKHFLNKYFMHVCQSVPHGNPNEINPESIP